MTSSLSDRLVGQATVARPAIVPGGRRTWSDFTMAQQAGILCSDPMFRQFLSERVCLVMDADDAAIVVRNRCLVLSRKSIRPGHISGRLWRDLVADFRVWEQS
jgi:hypothetical protein